MTDIFFNSNATYSGDGTMEKPVKSLSHRVVLPGDRWYLKTGSEFRESLSVNVNDFALKQYGNMDFPRPIITGADVFQVETRHGDLHTVDWPHSWGVQDFDHTNYPDLTRRCEMVFVGDVRLRQVGSEEELELGTFYVLDGQHIKFRWASPVTSVEIAVRPYCLHANGLTGLEVSGIEFRRSCGRIYKAGVNNTYVNDVSYKDCLIRQHNWHGLAFWCEAPTENVGIRVESTFCVDCGCDGIMGWRCRDFTGYDLHVGRSGWRVADYTDNRWGTGNKMHFMTNVHLTKYYGFENRFAGLWFDNTNVDIHITDSSFIDNNYHGIYLEYSPGPFLIKGSTFARNKLCGVHTSECPNVLFDTCAFSANGEGWEYGEDVLVGQWADEPRGGLWGENWTFKNCDPSPLVISYVNEHGTACPAEAKRRFSETVRFVDTDEPEVPEPPEPPVESDLPQRVSTLEEEMRLLETEVETVKFIAMANEQKLEKMRKALE